MLIPGTSVLKEHSGMDFLGFEVEYFKTKRSNILAKRNASIPKYTGLIDLPNENIGRVQNQGMEIQLSHFNKIGEVNFRASGKLLCSPEIKCCSWMKHHGVKDMNI